MKKDTDTKSVKSLGEPLNKDEENTSKSDKNIQLKQGTSENDKKIIKKEPGSPEIKKRL